ncbi:MAG: glycosyltransferase [Imperialibacter sp.]
MIKTLFFLSFHGGKKALVSLLKTPFRVMFWIAFFAIVYLSRKRRYKINSPRLLFGPDPILSNKYWCQALTAYGYKANTLMIEYYASINNKEDYDYYVDELFRNSRLLCLLLRYLNLTMPAAFLWAIYNYDIFHIPCHGFLLRGSFLKRYEHQILSFAKVKVIAKPYGSDFYRYSRVKDPLLLHALLKSYPHAARREAEIEENYTYWSRNADIIIPGIQLDGTGRWDVLPVSVVCIDTKKWAPKQSFSGNDGINGEVNIIHTPNHKGFKGTEFIEKAVSELKEEGLKVRLVLIQGMKNDQVQEIMVSKADILVEQIIASGYALSAIEGMASSLPVVSNITNGDYLGVFRKYSYLDECPIVGGNVYNIKEVIRTLVTNPELRKSAGMQARKYVEKYHSFEAYSTLMNKIYDRVWFGKEVSLINYYEPLNPDSYNNSYEQLKSINNS